MKIAMWSGPRNLSTAVMYAFGARRDFEVWDEPFYAPYLVATGIDHPMREAILKLEETDPNIVENRIRAYSGPLLMKLMTFHMISGFPRAWASQCINIHLIRHPARVVASYAAKREKPTLRDIGFVEQVELLDAFPGPVIDSADIREDPRRALTALCEAIDLSFDPAMLSWPAGAKPFDGAWAAHWYDAVHRSTGFAGPEGELPTVANDLGPLVEAAMPYYMHLKARALSL